MAASKSKQRRHLFLIFKEAINNIARHSGCKSVSLTITTQRNRLVAQIQDDGRGFEARLIEALRVDLAAGHGLFGIIVARRNPNAEIVAIDWPNVLQVARENALAVRVADRYSLIPGSAFDVDFGGEYDVVLVANFLHGFDAATGEKLLKKSMRRSSQAGE